MIFNTLYLKISWKQVEQVWKSAQIPQKKIIRHIYILSILSISYYLYYIYIILQYLYQLGIWKLGGTPLKKFHLSSQGRASWWHQSPPASSPARLPCSAEPHPPVGGWSKPIWGWWFLWWIRFFAENFYGDQIMVIKLWWFLVIYGDIPEFLWWFFADCEKRIEKAQLNEKNHMKINRYQQSGKSSKRIEVHWSTTVWK